MENNQLTSMTTKEINDAYLANYGDTSVEALVDNSVPNEAIISPQPEITAEEEVQ